MLVKLDGNVKLFEKAKETLLQKELTDMAPIYNRIPLADLNPAYAQAETISKLNTLHHTYRYDPRSECIIFESKVEDLEKTISSTINLYL